MISSNVNSNNLLNALLEYPEIKIEIENIFLVATLTDYKLRTRKAKTSSGYAFLLTFYNSEQELHLDFSFTDAELKEICMCKGDSNPECNSIACGNACKVLDVFKELM